MDFSIFKDCTPTNWKQKNAMSVMFKDRNRDFDTECVVAVECKGMEAILAEVNDMPIEAFELQRFYFKQLIYLGDVMDYKNVGLLAVEYNNGHIVFHIKFDIENPFIDEINALKEDMKQYDGMSNSQFASVYNEWDIKNTKKRNLDSYIPDFTYAYSYDVTQSLSMILAEMEKPEAKEHAKKAIKLIHGIRQIRASKGFDQMTYDQRKAYWKLNDEYNDITEAHIPTDEELAMRKRAQEQTEEEYKRQNNIAADLLTELLNEHTK